MESSPSPKQYRHHHSCQPAARAKEDNSLNQKIKRIGWGEEEAHVPLLPSFTLLLVLVNIYSDQTENWVFSSLISTDYLGFMKHVMITKHNNTRSFTRDQSIIPDLNLFQLSSLQHPRFLVKIKGDILLLSLSYNQLRGSSLQPDARRIHNAQYVSCFTNYSDSVLSLQLPRMLNNFISCLPTKHNILV